LAEHKMWAHHTNTTQYEAYFIVVMSIITVNIVV